MPITVAKFGGSSLKDNECIFRAAAAIKSEVYKGKRVVVVVSARGKTTDSLIDSAKEICASDSIPLHEMDKLLSTGETASAALFAMALLELSVKSVSLTGEKAGILTDSNFGNADIINIDTRKILELLNEGYVVVVAGFQGADENGNTTTLGRGGSDTTAAALANALKADECLIYTDVNGVYTADPRTIISSKKYDSVSFDTMVEFSRLGAKVLSFNSAKIAAENNINLYVLSPADHNNKTRISDETLPKYSDIVGVTLQEANSRGIVSAVCSDNNKTEYYLHRALHALKENGIICFNSKQNELSFSITVSRDDAVRSLKILHTIFF